MVYVVKCIILSVINDFVTKWLVCGIFNPCVCHCACRSKM